jgi:Domain of unknown function (DUF4129)
MMVETPVYRVWWAIIAGVMAGCLCLAVAGLPLHGGSPGSLGLLGGLNAIAGFATAPWLEGRSGWRRWTVGGAIPLGLALAGHVLPVAAVPFVWGLPLGLLCLVAGGSIALDLGRIDRSTDGEIVASAITRLGGNFLAGLILLFLLITFGSHRPALMTAGLYALVGVTALGWIEYRVRRRQWTTRGAEFRGSLGRRWLLSGLALFAVVVVLAALMPTNLLLALANSAWQVVGPLFARPVITLLDHFNIHYTVIRGGVPGGVHHYGAGRIPKNETAAHVHGETGSSWTGIALWTSVIVAVLYLGRAFWQHRFHGVRWRVALLGPLQALWQRLRFMASWSLDVVNVHLPDQIGVLLPGAGSGVPELSRRRFGRLTPRDRIGLYYVGVLHRARRCGISCPPWKTPREFVLVLGPITGDAHGDFVRLSDVFTEARYSRHEFSDSQVDQARADARRVREALREVQQPRPPAPPDLV